MTTSDNEWQLVAQLVTTSGTTIDNKWQRVTASDKGWQWVVILANFPFFRIREEPTTMHPKGTLNIEEDLEERLLK